MEVPVFLCGEECALMWAKSVMMKADTSDESYVDDDDDDEEEEDISESLEGRD